MGNRVQNYLTDLAYALDYAYTTCNAYTSNPVVTDGQTTRLTGAQGATVCINNQTTVDACALCQEDTTKHDNDLITAVLNLRNPKNQTNVVASCMRDTVCAYDANGQLIQGSIPLKTSTDVTCTCISNQKAPTGVCPTYTIPTGYYASPVDVSVNLGTYTANAQTCTLCTQGTSKTYPAGYYSGDVTVTACLGNAVISCTPPSHSTCLIICNAVGGYLRKGIIYQQNYVGAPSQEWVYFRGSFIGATGCYCCGELLQASALPSACGNAICTMTKLARCLGYTTYPSCLGTCPHRVAMVSCQIGGSCVIFKSACITSSNTVGCFRDSVLYDFSKAQSQNPLLCVCASYYSSCCLLWGNSVAYSTAGGVPYYPVFIGCITYTPYPYNPAGGFTTEYYVKFWFGTYGFPIKVGSNLKTGDVIFATVRPYNNDQTSCYIEYSTYSTCSSTVTCGITIGNICRTNASGYILSGQISMYVCCIRAGSSYTCGFICMCAAWGNYISVTAPTS